MNDNKQLIQDVIDRILYCKGFKEELELLISHYDPHKEVKFTDKIENFKFPLDKAI